MVTARIEASKLYWSTTIIRKHQFAHANLPVMILNIIFLISYRILKVLFTFYWKQTKMHIQYLGHITHMSVLQLAACQLQQHLAARKTDKPVASLLAGRYQAEAGRRCLRPLLVKSRFMRTERTQNSHWSEVPHELLCISLICAFRIFFSLPNGVRRRPGYKIWRLFKFEFSEVNINQYK